MKKALFLLAVCAAMLANSQSAQACGYGGFDPDVETAMTGDPIQAKLAMQRLWDRGISALRPLHRYRVRAASQQQSYQTYLHNLFARTNTKMTEEQRRREIKRANDFLIFNEQRLLKLNLLIQRIGGRGVTGESLVSPSNIG